jgi:hypothetical protein
MNKCKQKPKMQIKRTTAYKIQRNEIEEKMENLFYNRRRCERSDQRTSWRHISSVDVTAEKIVYIFL